MHAFRRRIVLGLVILASAGCTQSGHDYYAKETTPVMGRLTVDGKPPGAPVTVTCHPASGPDLEHPTITQALTNENGEFTFSTYKSGDGVPPGEYKLTFFWGKFNAMTRSFAGPDRLKNRYRKPEKSPVSLSVSEGEPVDLGEIALTTK